MRQQQQLPAAALVFLTTVLPLAAAAACDVQQQPTNCQCNGTFRVLALGDSLTRGAVPSQRSNHPYSLKLQQLLTIKFGSRARANVTTVGYDYMGVIQKGHNAAGKPTNMTLVPLAQQLLTRATRSRNAYNWVVVLAGINDLGAGNHTATSIMPKLQQVYSMALKAGANVLAIQLFPNRFVSQTSNNEKQRRLLNTMLRDYVSKQPARASCDQAKLLFLELPDAVFDFWSMPTGRIKQMQDDQLHLTPQGYDLLGGLVFDRISRETPLNACQCPSGSKSSAQLP